MKVIAVLCLLVASVAAGSYGNFEEIRSAPLRRVESYAAPIRHLESYSLPTRTVVDSHTSVTPVREIVESYSGSPVREIITEHSYAAPLPVRDLSYGHEERFMSSPIRQLSYGHEERLIAAPVRALHHERFISRPVSRLVSGPSGQTRFDHLINPAAHSYDVNFETYNGIVSHEAGHQVPHHGFRSTGYGYGAEIVEDGEFVKRGETSWTSPEGKHFTLKYTADATGYHPQVTEDGVALKLGY